MHLLLLIHAVQSSPFKMSQLVVSLTSEQQKFDEVVQKDSDFKQIEIIFLSSLLFGLYLSHHHYSIFKGKQILHI